MGRGMIRGLSGFCNKDGVDEKLEEVQIMMECCGCADITLVKFGYPLSGETWSW